MIEIRKDDLSSGHVIRLLEEHRQEMFKHSPPESVHALDIPAMQAPEITFWSAWLDNEFTGCGALKELNFNDVERYGEIKSMKTCANHLRQGVAMALMAQLIEVAKQRGYSRLSLETGTMPAFIAARTLYQKLGFRKCPPFANYVEDPHSVCMTLDLLTIDQSGFF